MNKRYNFTLVELLVVIGIISILAGLVLGAVSLSQSSARNTQAKSDMASIILALRGVETTYGKLVNTSGTFNGKTAAKKDSQNSNDTWFIDGDTYDAFIAELSVPKNSAVLTLNINKRKIVFLEPKSDFDPSAAYTGQTSKLWRDPWGNTYKVYINVEGEKYLKVGNNKVATDVAIYSLGANGADEQGCHADLDECISTNDSQQHKLCDDIVSWRK